MPRRRSLACRCPIRELMGNVGIPLLAQMQIFSAEHAEDLVSEYRAHNARVHDDLIAGYPGVTGVLEGLIADGIPLGIVTSKSRSVACRGIDHFDIGRFLRGSGMR